MPPRLGRSRFWKLTPGIALTMAVVLLIAGVLMAVYGESSYRAQKVNEVSVQAEILAATVPAALAFVDRRAAQEYVDAMQANPEVQTAALYDDKGSLFAGYARPGAPSVPRSLPGRGPAFDSDRLMVTAPVVQGSSTLGTVYLQTIIDPFARRLERYGVIAVLVVMAALVVGVLGIAHSTLTKANADLEGRARELAAANAALETQIAEREKAEAALRQAQKMEAIGQLTGGVAHDFNNLLTAVLGNLELLNPRIQGDRERRWLEGAVRSAERGARLVEQLLAFSRRQRLDPSPVDLNALVLGMDALLRSTLGGTVRVETITSPGLWLAFADQTQLELVILNLAINGRDAMPGGGVITIETANVVIGAPARPEQPPAGEYVAVSVSDTGSGIPDEVLSHVFEPFFTTKEVGKGSGLGLPQVLGVAQQLGGGVSIDSRPGAGTRVTVYLPRAAAPVAAGEARPAPADAADLSGVRVLVVDDDGEVRRVTASMLEALGCGVVDAETGSAAIDLVGRGAAIDIVLMDYAMPGMSGAEAAQRIHALRPELPIMFVTGHAEASALTASLTPERTVRKPFRAEDLARRLAGLLHRRDAARA